MDRQVTRFRWRCECRNMHMAAAGTAHAQLWITSICFLRHCLPSPLRKLTLISSLKLRALCASVVNFLLCVLLLSLSSLAVCQPLNFSQFFLIFEDALLW